MQKPNWPVRSSSYVIDSPFMRVRLDELELPSGSVVPYYVRESHGFVMIFALTSAREVVLVRQYRYGNDSIALELPAGSLEAGEDPLACAKRELAEETGYTASRWEPLVRIPAEPVRSTSMLHAFIAYDAVPTTAQHLDPTEIIEPHAVSLDELRDLARSGELGSVACIAVTFAALDRLATFTTSP
ncbi:MAG: NUDIX hydrolase [bacterium]|nr:NUDIX hydrolase [bacterium]